MDVNRNGDDISYDIAICSKLNKETYQSFCHWLLAICYNSSYLQICVVYDAQSAQIQQFLFARDINIVKLKLGLTNLSQYSKLVFEYQRATKDWSMRLSINSLSPYALSLFILIFLRRESVNLLASFCEWNSIHGNSRHSNDLCKAKP